jgi:hypothetical protein
METRRMERTIERTLRSALARARRGHPSAPARLTDARLRVLDQAIADAANSPEGDLEATRRLILQGSVTIIEVNGSLSVARIR